MGEIADALRQTRRSEEERTRLEHRRREIEPELARALDIADPERPTEGIPSVDPHDGGGAEPRILKREGDDEFRPARIGLADPHNAFSQQYRRLALRLRDEADARCCRSIVMTSAQSGEGKTTTSCNLAVELGRLHQASRVVLVDLDLRRPSVDRALGVAPDVTVDAVLRGDASASEAVVSTDVSGLSILAQTEPVADPEWLLASPGLESMIRDLEQQFDWVLIDTPPVLAASDAQIILRHASAAILVARAGVSPVASVRRAIDRLPAPKVLGSFLNSSRKGPDDALYQEYAYRPDDESASEPVPGSSADGPREDARGAGDGE